MSRCLSIIRSGILLLVLTMATTAEARNLLGDLLNAYSKYQEVNMLLWLSGDVKAEKRFGQEVKWFLNLTNKKVKDPETLRWVNTIFDRIKPHFRDRGFDYDITVYEGNTVNAFAIPGGNIFIYKGMLDFVGSDDELAAVLAHELAHAERRHSLKHFRQSVAFQLLLQKAVKNKRDRETWGALVGALTMLKFSREDEVEADDLGQAKLFAAGFNPAAQVVLWEKFVAKFGKGDKGLMQYLSTHPPSQDRVEFARKNLAKFQVPETRDFNLSFNLLSDVQDNLLQNGSFETDLIARGQPDAWTVKEGKAFLAEGGAMTGRRSLQVVTESGLRPARVVSEFIAVKPDSRLTFTGAVRGEGDGQRVSIGAELYDAKKRLRGFIWPILANQPVTSAWTKVQGAIEGGPTPDRHLQKDTAFIRLILQQGPMSKGSVWFDDLLLQRAGVSRPTNLVAGGDFEYAGPGGLPEGLTGTPGALARDIQRFKTGYASLRLANAGSGETEVEFPPIPLNSLKEGQELQGTFHFCGSAEIKGRCLLEFLDEAGNPLSRRLIDKEFTAKPDLWQATGFRARVRFEGQEKAVARSVGLRFVAQIPAGAHLWLDGVILR
ncbi:MAG: hypothetical protein OZSIB_1833 [Candidatus Ozemobacter sibiricus]|jgi:Zn-dependent protease with chaperone function|uniref:Peptidase M48 domain-containing protein n=1 Tax=Candidatus Ozemobacter sibiricus TaxID=2268124 RepID=A0A367ZJM7_9BACT|nr:MAG: hypothetical protein OZSIB_1833 [Candidatus Ozemobacter sibiricus]